VSVAARPANHESGSANRIVDLRTAPVRAGTFRWDGPDVDTGWHRHPYHQVEYALEGVAEVETDAGRYLLPPQQAIWIPADLPHETRLHDVRSVSVFLAADMVPHARDRARVLAAAPVVREMIVYGLRWPIDRAEHDRDADVFFEALARVVVDWLDRESPLWLPTTTDPLLADVLAHTDEQLPTVTMASVCRAVGVSERTLRRRFPAVLGMTWREYVQHARLLRAMALLGDGDSSVVDAAVAVGFDSASAFARAFHQRMGESPSAYRRRVRSAVS
jgi:AraC-like DNA-binding protein